ncbi:MAG: DUF3854 domain-containing protein [Prolixibacteraceae bacterium]|nr:DUF3854 domain-containing protein [Prolixibacteraceae bacterium]
MDNIVNLKEDTWIANDLNRSGLRQDIVDEMGIRPVKTSAEMNDLIGFSSMGGQKLLQSVDAYAIPYKHASEPFVRVKLSVEYEGAKYLSPLASHCQSTQHLYYLERELIKLGNASIPLIIVEGEKKTAKVTQELAGKEFAIVGIAGVEMFRCPEWSRVTLSCRNVYICFDSDYLKKPLVQQALLKLFLFLRKKKSNPAVIDFSETSKGIDDYLVAIEKEGKNPQAEMISLVQKAGTKGIWNNHVNHQKLAELLAESYYSTDIDSRSLFESYKLKDVYQISWTTFKNEVKKAWKEKQNREMAEKEKKTVIKIEGGMLNEALDKMEKILSENGIYQRSGHLVRVSKEFKPIKTIKRGIDTWTIQQVDAAYIVKLLTEKAVWLKQNHEGWERADCPRNYAEIYVGAKDWNLPVLTGIISSPILREDGSILEQPGYDKETGLFLCAGKEIKIPENPTKEDALAAKELLLWVVKDFPFANEAARSVWLTFVLTAIHRKSIRTAPACGFSAPKMANGKSLLADIIALIATGSNASMISQSKSEEEDKKKYLSLLMSGDQVICIDNAEYPIQGEALCTILTQEYWKERLLGVNQMVEVSTSATFLTTGNNLSFRGDMTSRALLCSIDAGCERPEEREFDIDPRTWVPQHRNELLVAALTILRAFHLAGKPCVVKQFGRFEEWNSWIRAAVVWLGMEDPCKTREKIEEGDNVRNEIRALLHAWSDYTTEPITIKELIAASKTHDALEDILNDLAGGKEGVNSKKLANFLRKIKNRWEDGMAIVDAGKNRDDIMRWQVSLSQNLADSILLKKIYKIEK